MVIHKDEDTGYRKRSRKALYAAWKNTENEERNTENVY